MDYVSIEKNMFYQKQQNMQKSKRCEIAKVVKQIIQQQQQLEEKQQFSTWLERCCIQWTSGQRTAKAFSRGASPTAGVATVCRLVTAHIFTQKEPQPPNQTKPNSIQVRLQHKHKPRREPEPESELEPVAYRNVNLDGNFNRKSNKVRCTALAGTTGSVAQPELKRGMRMWVRKKAANTQRRWAYKTLAN